MKKNIIFPILSLTCAWFSLLNAAPQPVRQDALDRVEPSETLVAGIAALDGNALIIEVMGEERPSPWLHMFIDSDGDKQTGFNHYLGGTAGRGLDMMIEGDIAYRFSGEDPSVWSWTPDTTVSVNRRYHEDVFVVELPASAVKLSQTPTFLSVVYTDGYAEALDSLPRNGSVWTVSKDDGSASLKDGTSDWMASILSGSDFAEKKTALSRGSIDRRKAFDQIESYVCYYGSGQIEAMSARDAAIIETKNQTPETIARLQAADTLVIGYISVGEDDDFRVGDGRGPGGYDSAYFDRDGDNVADQNPIWKSHYADARQPSWRRYFLDRAYEMRQQYGVDGFFLDTVDTSELYKESEEAMVSLIQELRAQNPESIIVLNRGFHTVEALAPVVDGVMFESFTTTYDFEDKEYIMQRPSGWDWGLDVYLQTLKPAMDDYGLVVLVLDYVISEVAPEVETAYDRAATFGYVPEVSTIYLDAIYDVDYEGKPDPKYLEVQATPEVMAYTLSEPRNGFPEDTVVMPSSVYSDYAVSPVVDGVDEKSSLHWRNRAWASRDRAEAHSLEFYLPQPVAAREMKIDWAFDNGLHYPASNFRVEVKAGDSEEWFEVARKESNDAPVTRVALGSNPIRSVRVIQEPGGGSPDRPNLMWVQQVELIQ